MKIKYNSKVYTSFILNYIDGEVVKANLLENKTEVVVLGKQVKELEFIYN